MASSYSEKERGRGPDVGFKKPPQGMVTEPWPHGHRGERGLGVSWSKWAQKL